MLATRAILLITTLLACQPAFAQSPEQIERGRRLFFEETFGGNGRTCGTCHPATNNFTLDPAFVRALPRNDPLFIIRSTPELRDLEIRRFLREGTILENVDGFPNPGVMRGVPHTLALRTSIGNGATGWSGDGSPGDLRDFATGAVTQHFPKTLNRVPGVDFRLPTPEELDDMLAFQLSLGRQQDIDLATLPEFADDRVEEGRALFQSALTRDGTTRACSFCHTNGGTNDGDFDTGVAKLPNAPACRLVGRIRGVPGDGGKGSQPVNEMTRGSCNRLGLRPIVFGATAINTPPAIEAADTPPFPQQCGGDEEGVSAAAHTKRQDDRQGPRAGRRRLAGRPARLRDRRGDPALPQDLEPGAGRGLPVADPEELDDMLAFQLVSAGSRTLIWQPCPSSPTTGWRRGVPCSRVR